MQFNKFSTTDNHALDRFMNTNKFSVHKVEYSDGVYPVVTIVAPIVCSMHEIIISPIDSSQINTFQLKITLIESIFCVELNINSSEYKYEFLGDSVAHILCEIEENLNEQWQSYRRKLNSN